MKDQCVCSRAVKCNYQGSGVSEESGAAVEAVLRPEHTNLAPHLWMLQEIFGMFAAALVGRVELTFRCEASFWLNHTHSHREEESSWFNRGR